MILSKIARVKAEINEGFECAVIDASETSDWLGYCRKEGRSGCSKDIRNRLQNLHGDFRYYGMLAVGGSQWDWKESRETLVRPVLQYGCETWMIKKTDERKLPVSNANARDR